MARKAEKQKRERDVRATRRSRVGERDLRVAARQLKRRNADRLAAARERATNARRHGNVVGPAGVEAAAEARLWESVEPLHGPVEDGVQRGVYGDEENTARSPDDDDDSSDDEDEAGRISARVKANKYHAGGKHNRAADVARLQELSPDDIPTADRIRQLTASWKTEADRVLQMLEAEVQRNQHLMNESVKSKKREYIWKELLKQQFEKRQAAERRNEGVETADAGTDPHYTDQPGRWEHMFAVATDEVKKRQARIAELEAQLARGPDNEASLTILREARRQVDILKAEIRQLRQDNELLRNLPDAPGYNPSSAEWKIIVKKFLELGDEQKARIAALEHDNELLRNLPDAPGHSPPRLAPARNPLNEAAVQTGPDLAYEDLQNQLLANQDVVRMNRAQIAENHRLAEEALEAQRRLLAASREERERVFQQLVEERRQRVQNEERRENWERRALEAEANLDRERADRARDREQLYAERLERDLQEERRIGERVQEILDGRRRSSRDPAPHVPADMPASREAAYELVPPDTWPLVPANGSIFLPNGDEVQNHKLVDMYYNPITGRLNNDKTRAAALRVFRARRRDPKNMSLTPNRFPAHSTRLLGDLPIGVREYY